MTAAAAFVCQVCDADRVLWAWTDSHGVAQCSMCGAPYRLFHYDGEGNERRRVEKPPELLVDAEAARRCFVATGAKLSAVGLHLSFPGGYDVASRDDIRKVSEWWKSQPETAEP
jgi:hypothetical protein